MVDEGTFRVKSSLAEMLKGRVIMDVTTAEQAKIAEDAAMIRTKGEPGTGNAIEAVRHMRLMNEQIPEHEMMQVR